MHALYMAVHTGVNACAMHYVSVLEDENVVAYQCV